MTFLTLLRLKHVFVCCRHGHVWWTAAMATRSTQWMTKKVLDHHQGASLVCLNSLISFSFNTWNIMFVYTLFDWHCHIFNWFIDWCQTKFKQTGPLWSILDGPVWQEYKIRQMWQAKGNPVINKQVAENFYKLIHWYTIPYIYIPHTMISLISDSQILVFHVEIIVSYPSRVAGFLHLHGKSEFSIFLSRD